MVRIYPKMIQNRAFLSRLLEYYLSTLEHSALGLTLTNISWDTRIPETVLRRLMAYYRTPADSGIITAEDFHIVFRNIMVHYPTVRLWREKNGETFISV